MSDSNAQADTGDKGLEVASDTTAGLLPPWQAGERGNPLGKTPRTAGGAIKHRMNACRKMSLAQLEAIVNNGDSIACEVIAARRTITAMADEGYLSMHTTGMILDYTDGRPVNHVVVEQVSSADPAAQLTDLLDRVRSQGIAVPEPILIESKVRDVVKDSPVGEQSLHSDEQGSAEGESRSNEG